MNRREMIKNAGIVGLGTLLSSSIINGKNYDVKKDGKLKVIVAGAHPDDPELSCGGTIKLLTNAGHEVVIYYLTKGQIGIKGKTPEQTSTIRKKEAKAACKILGAKPFFGKQFDGSTEINNKRFNEVLEFVEKEQPDIVFTHWPIDTHPDHRACSNLFYNAWLKSGKPFNLYYFEVSTGNETQMFNPSVYVEINSVLEDKHKACFAHESQNVKQWYAEIHGVIEKFRGMNLYSKYGEAFIHQLPHDSGFIK